MGVVVWPMVELEADDALASAAHLAAADPRVEKVCIWTPDKDLAQCVVGDRVVQVDRKSGQIRDADGVRAKFGVRARAHPRLSRARRATPPTAIPGFRGIGPKTAAQLIGRYGALEDFPPEVAARAACERGAAVQAARDAARPTRRSSPTSTSCAGAAPTDAFAAAAERIGDARLLPRVAALSSRLPAH